MLCESGVIAERERVVVVVVVVTNKTPYREPSQAKLRVLELIQRHRVVEFDREESAEFRGVSGLVG